jgi:hypothetical protein
VRERGAHQRLAWETDDEASAARGFGYKISERQEELKQINDGWGLELALDRGILLARGLCNCESSWHLLVG